MVPAGRVRTILAIQRNTVLQQTRDLRAAVLAPMPTPRITQTNTRSGYKHMLKPKCPPSRLLRAGSTGHGVPSPLHNGVTARRGRMATCQKRPIRLLSNAEMMCLTFPDYRNITDFMKRPLFCCYLCDDSQSEYISPLALAFLAHVYHAYYIDHIPIHTPPTWKSIIYIYLRRSPIFLHGVLIHPDEIIYVLSFKPSTLLPHSRLVDAIVSGLEV